MGLTNHKITHAQIGKKLHDGLGLYLTLSSPGRGKWTMRYMLKRKAKEMGLGRFPDISLIEARKRHLAARLTIANGDDPIEIKRKKSEQERIEATIRFSRLQPDLLL